MAGIIPCAAFRLASLTWQYALRSPLSFHGLLAPFSVALSNACCLQIPQFGYPSPAEGYFGGFQVLAGVSKVALNVCVRVSMWTEVFSSFG